MNGKFKLEKLISHLPISKYFHFSGQSSTPSALTTTTELHVPTASIPPSGTTILLANLPHTYRIFSENEGEKFSDEFQVVISKCISLCIL